MPQASIDPVVMAAATVMRLQTIVSREVAAAEAAVVTVGALQAGTKENVIPDEAIIKLNVRTFDAGVRKRVLAAIERIVNAEAEASGAPRKPEITKLDHYPLNVNDRDASKRVVDAFRGYFGAERGSGDRTGAGERGFRIVRDRVACAFGILVRGRHRSCDLCQSQRGQSTQRTSCQPQPKVCSGDPSDLGNGCRDVGRRGTSLVVGLRNSMLSIGCLKISEPGVPL